jgi:hypothetical protein
MERKITYCLREEALDSNDFYATLSSFAYAWTEGTLPGVADLVDEFRSERAQRGLPDRPPASCAFDLLVLGVFLREHGRESAVLPDWAERFMRTLLSIQERWLWSKEFVKVLRGIAWYVSRLWDERTGKRASIASLTAWLRATGEATCASRLEEWLEFLRARGREVEAVRRCLSLAEDFAEASLQTLGRYTENVETFLAEEAPLHRFRYDAALLQRTRVEYHLGMLGNEILNRQYRQKFLETEHKTVILPPCMRAQPEAKCKAVQTLFGEKCAACTPSCRIHQITKLGEKYGFEVFMIPDELRVFGNKDSDKPVGLVGVSCVLTNWGGGWDAEHLGVPAQGVLLDYVGCKYHWDKKGFPTDINLRRLISVLGLE